MKLAVGFAAAAVFVPFIRDLRLSDTLNRVVDLNSQVHAAVLHSVARARAVEDSGARLRSKFDHKSMRALRLVPRQPAIAYWIRAPFYQEMKPAELRARPGELIAVDMGDDEARSWTGSLAAAMGIPDLVRSPGAVAVFPATVARSDPRTRFACPDEPIGPGLKLTEVRWAWTLDGARAGAAVLVEGWPLPPTSVRRQLVVCIEDAAGRTIASSAMRLEEPRSAHRQPVDSNAGRFAPMPGLLRWVEFPAEVALLAEKVRIEVSDDGPPARVELILGGLGQGRAIPK